MAYSAQIISDMVNPSGQRLTSFLVTYPLIVHNEHLRHREQSFCVASNRAIPVSRLIEQVMLDPYIPIWQHNQPGMEASARPVTLGEEQLATALWLEARDEAVKKVETLSRKGGLDMHKQWVNRLLMPWQWITVLCSATSWANFWSLRCHPAAQPDFQRIAGMMCVAYHEARPIEAELGDWALPFVTPGERNELPIKEAKMVSAARCARTSYLNHLGQRDIQEDLVLAQRLEMGNPPHASPFEHVAQAVRTDGPSGRCRNFFGWQQMRVEIQGDTSYEFDYRKWLDSLQYQVIHKQRG